ncbi:rRNA biogenesis protein RRP36 [Spathaspora sp. JA1]|nr:rRNA biogenesis protein RRP36 [Spathaspora sp. JA1]
MAKYKTVRPKYEDESSEEDIADNRRNNYSDEEDEELSKISFGALNAAQSKLKSYSDDEDEFLESDSDSAPEETSSRKHINKTNKKRSKHGPSEQSSKRPVSKIRDIPGLEVKKTGLYTDIRFDAAYGKADLNRARRDYAFLDEYRQSEIKNMEQVLKDKKSANILRESQREEIKLELQSLKSRMDTLKNRDLENQILSSHKQKQLHDFKVGKSSNPYFLKRSEKRKILQKAKFDAMKPRQREKVMERKRKKRLGKEFKQLEFRQNH